MATVFRNGRVFDGHRYVGAADVLVDGGRVVAVGEPGQVDGPSGAQEVDVAGGLVAPGFVDAHAHPVHGGLERIECDLSDVPVDEEAYLAAVGAYARAHPDVPWILGGGWAMAAFPGGTPSRRARPRRPRPPGLPPNRDGHGAWVNGAALARRVSIGHPRPGRRPHGAGRRWRAPTGTLHEGAMSLVQAAPPPTRP